MCSGVWNFKAVSKVFGLWHISCFLIFICVFILRCHIPSKGKYCAILRNILVVFVVVVVVVGPCCSSKKRPYIKGPSPAPQKAPSLVYLETTVPLLL